jgi:hypothetical protein
MPLEPAGIVTVDTFEPANEAANTPLAELEVSVTGISTSDVVSWPSASVSEIVIGPRLALCAVEPDSGPEVKVNAAASCPVIGVEYDQPLEVV